MENLGACPPYSPPPIWGALCVGISRMQYQEPPTGLQNGFSPEYGLAETWFIGKNGGCAPAPPICAALSTVGDAIHKFLRCPMPFILVQRWQ